MSMQKFEPKVPPLRRWLAQKLLGRLIGVAVAIPLVLVIAVVGHFVRTCSRLSPEQVRAIEAAAEEPFLQEARRQDQLKSTEARSRKFAAEATMNRPNLYSGPDLILALMRENDLQAGCAMIRALAILNQPAAAGALGFVERYDWRRAGPAPETAELLNDLVPNLLIREGKLTPVERASRSPIWQVRYVAAVVLRRMGLPSGHLKVDPREEVRRVAHDEGLHLF